MRLTLDGRVLTAKIANARGGDLDLEEQLYGKRIDAVCSSSFLHPRRRSVVRTRLWPVGTRRLSFRFRHDISRGAKWCLIEQDAADIASVSFIRPEPTRLVGKGRGPSGNWWRLGGRRGLLAEPCVLFRIRGAAAEHCFETFADRAVTLDVDHWAPCTTDVYFFGVAAPSATVVRLTLADGTAVETNIYDRPAGSLVRARFFAAALPARTLVRSVEALDAAGASLGLERVRDYTREFCG